MKKHIWYGDKEVKNEVADALEVAIQVIEELPGQEKLVFLLEEALKKVVSE